MHPVDAASDLHKAALVVASGVSIDFESQSVYQISVLFEDGATAGPFPPGRRQLLSASVDLSITVLDLNEVPFFNEDQSNEYGVLENAVSGTELDGPVLLASDPDASDSLTWSISGGSGSDRFAINTATG